MEYQKITNLLGKKSDKVHRFVTKKWIEVHDQSGETYNTNKQIRFKTSMLRSDLCDFSDAYIVVKKKVLLQILTMMHMIKSWLSKIMHHLLVAF